MLGVLAIRVAAWEEEHRLHGEGGWWVVGRIGWKTWRLQLRIVAAGIMVVIVTIVITVIESRRYD